MIKKLIHIALFILLPAGLFLVLGFARNSNLQKPCRHLVIRVESAEDNHFLHAPDVREIINVRLDTLEGKPLTPELLDEVKQIVQGISHVKQANTYRTINNDLKINIRLREPLMRIINTQNQSFYVDQEGDLFPLSDNYTARVPIVTGQIHTEYSPGYNLLEAEAGNDDPLADLYKLAGFIAEEAFWNAFIEHIYVTSGGKFELTPKNGAHIIVFGHARDIETKLSNLKKFYLNTLPQKGWDRYSKVNIEFNNQIICSK